MRTRLRPAAALLAGAILASCDSPSGPDEPGVPDTAAVVSGDLQHATVATALSQPLVVRITDAEGDPVPGQVLDFRVVTGGGTLAAGAALTDENGLAADRWTLGTVAGDTQRVEVRVLGEEAAVLATAVFRAVGTADAPVAIAAVGDSARTGPSGSRLADSLAARVTDQYGNPVPGAAVVWTVRAGGGSIDPGTTTTGADGVARAAWTLGTRVDTTHVAEAAAGLTLRAGFTATPGLPFGTTVAVVSGGGQTGTVGTALPEPLRVAVRLPDGRGLQGVTVTWSILGGTGGITPPTAVTDGRGEVAAEWTLGTLAGVHPATASVDGPAGAPLSATLTATATPDAPHAVIPAGAAQRSGTLGQRLADSLAVLVSDRHGNPVPGVGVAWIVRAGGGSVSPASGTTDAGGMAKTAWTLGLRADTTHVAEAVAAMSLTARFTATGALPIGTTIALASGGGQTAPVGTGLPSPVRVVVRAADGRPLQGVPVSWAVAAGGGTLVPAAATTNGNGEVSAAWTLGTAAGTQSATASTGGASVTVHATAAPGAPHTVAPVGAAQRSGTAGQALADSLGVKVTDRYGNPVPGVGVAWIVRAGGGSVSPASGTTGAGGIAKTAWTLGLRVDTTHVAEAVAAMSLTTTFAATVASGTLQVVKLSGGGQTGTVGTALAQPLRVAVRTADGRGVQGVTVTWAAGGGSVAPATSVTDASGEASTRWTLGTVAGAQSATAAVSGATGVSFAATAVPGPAAALVKQSGDGQTAPPGVLLSAPLVVRATDTHGNAVPGLEVAWTVTGGGGSAAPDTSATDAAGTASSRWTLGSVAGTQTLRASSGALAPVEFTATAADSQSVRITIEEPAENAVVGDTFWVQAWVTSADASVSSFTAHVEDRVATLRRDDRWGYFYARMVLTGLPYGSLQLRVQAATVDGGYGVATRTIIRDARPTLSMSSPEGWSVVAGQVRVDLDCTDHEPTGCTEVKVFVQPPSNASGAPPGRLLASGTTGVHGTFSIAEFDGWPVTIAAQGRDARGQYTSVSRQLYVQSSPRWSAVVSGHGVLLDYDASRTLSYLPWPNRVVIGDRSTGDTTTAWSGTSTTTPMATEEFRAALHPEGAAFSLGRLSGHPVFDWRNGSLRTLAGSDMRVAGAWAVHFPYSVRRTNLLTGETVVVSPSSSDDGNVAANGDAVWQSSGTIYRYRNGTTTAISGTSGRHPVTDGEIVVFRVGQTYAVVNAAGETSILASSGGFLPLPETDYRVADGWIAYRMEDALGRRQIWTRSPDGVVRQVSRRATEAELLAVSDQGHVAFGTGGRLYVARPPYDAPVDVGAHHYHRLPLTMEWRGGELIALLGRTASVIDY